MAKVTLKNAPTTASVSVFMAEIEDPEQRRDCREVSRLMRRVSGKRAKMWGESMVGYGRYTYRYASGRIGEWFRLGFSPRKDNISVYIMPGYTSFDPILARLGKHKKGKSCLYIRRLADIDVGVLAELLQAGWDDMALKYPEA
ncbi:MAG: DUF1801 domain-containing protein [Myxococcota bacterium]